MAQELSGIMVFLLRKFPSSGVALCIMGFILSAGGTFEERCVGDRVLHDVLRPPLFRYSMAATSYVQKAVCSIFTHQPARCCSRFILGGIDPVEYKGKLLSPCAGYLLLVSNFSESLYRTSCSM